MFTKFTNNIISMIIFFKKFPIAIFILILLIWMANYFLMEIFDDPNEVGDSYGALNTLFSGLAFAGIIISIFTQNEELKLQREEIKLNRKELTENRKELANQASHMERQAENLKISAKLSALTALLNYYLEVQGRSENPYMFDNKIRRTVNEIETINNLKTL